MLELGRLAERVDQRLAVLEPARLRVALAPSDGEDVGKRSVRARRETFSIIGYPSFIAGSRPGQV